MSHCPVRSRITRVIPNKNLISVFRFNSIPHFAGWGVFFRIFKTRRVTTVYHFFITHIMSYLFMMYRPSPIYLKYGPLYEYKIWSVKICYSQCEKVSNINLRRRVLSQQAWNWKAYSFGRHHSSFKINHSVLYPVDVIFIYIMAWIRP